MEFKWLRERNGFYDNAHKIKKIGYSCIIPFVYEGKEELHKYMQYEVSMTVFMGRIANQRKIPKWLSFTKSVSLNI